MAGKVWRRGQNERTQGKQGGHMAETWRLRRTHGGQTADTRRTHGGQSVETRPNLNQGGHAADNGGHMADKHADAARAYRGQPFSFKRELHSKLFGENAIGS